MFSSLDRHLRRPEQHDGLPFHADCPVCRQRLAGTLPREGPLTRQAQAALAAGVLAVSAASPAAAVAQPSGDAAATAQQSPAPPPPTPPADPTLDPGWEAPGPEGESGEEAPEQAPPAVDDGLGGGEEETGLVEIEPPVDAIPDQPTLEAAPPPAPPAPPAPPIEQPPPPEPAPVPAPAPPVEQPPAPAPEVEQPPAGQPAADAKPHRETKKRAGKVRQRARELARKITAAPESVASQSTVQPPPTTTTAVTPAVAQAPVDPQPVAISRAAIKGDTYTVRPGDSLWSIAQRELGSNASTGQVAREVHRLWTLNADQIATGDPNLLRVGTVLTLR